MPLTLQKDRIRRRGTDQVDDDLLDALHELLAEGFSIRDISIEQLCARANCARTNFYRRYSDRGAIVRDLSVRRIMPAEIEKLERVMSKEACAGLTVREIYYRFIEAALEQFRTNREVKFAMYQTLGDSEPNEAFQAAAEEYAERTTSALIDRLRERAGRIGIPNWEGAVMFATSNNTLAIREAVYFGGEKPRTVTAERSDKELLRRLSDMVIAYLQVDESGNAKAGGNGA